MTGLLTDAVTFAATPPQTVPAWGPVLPTYIPVDVDIDAVTGAVATYAVSAPAPAMPGLRAVVHEARDDGVNLKIVVVETDPPIDTPLRDIATLVGREYSDATVLVVSPSYAGTYSPQFDRVTLEAGEDVAKTGDPVVSAQNFLHQLTTPTFPWTAFTMVLLVVVVAAAVGTRALQHRANSAAEPQAAEVDPVA
ncbi:MAG TPA: DUF6676 family protein [Mycolicibacillus parakoreensis]|uniref:Uncharacterized protein n=1 Tax=Mycolicibacillus parakoreensis TaxID=1069221 RepID=A0ABY3TVF5_9MYCO|nr:DUF6676 family protein [Mycolicibacillus parakoreensis]ULN51182.1 hypothetical protein MIU77_09475 [Mycolicibacillus parakoreensis]HLR98625.1 DUF6676 family protein [Mycolicibacillus parakoreensis]